MEFAISGGSHLYYGTQNKILSSSRVKNGISIQNTYDNRHFIAQSVNLRTFCKVGLSVASILDSSKRAAVLFRNFMDCDLGDFKVTLLRNSALYIYFCGFS